MKTKILLVCSFLVISISTWADEPDDSGIGGTGRGGPPDIEFFEAPDVLEALDIPLPTDDIPDFGAIDDLPDADELLNDEIVVEEPVDVTIGK